MVLKVFKLKEVRSVPDDSDRLSYIELGDKEKTQFILDKENELADVKRIDLPIIRTAHFIEGHKIENNVVIMDEAVNLIFYNEQLRMRALGESLVTQQSLSNQYYKMFQSLGDKKFFSRLRYLFSPKRFIKDTEIDYGV